MVDSGVRIAAAFLPAGVPVVVGIVLAVLRRRVMPRVSLPAVIGLSLQLVILVISAFLVGVLGLLPARGWSAEEIRTLSSVLGFVVIVLQLVSWTLILMALFARLPAKAVDRTPTGRHALLDARGAQVVAEEGTTLLPVAAGIGVAGAGLGAAGVAAAESGDAPAWETPPVQPTPPAPWAVPDEPADTETITTTSDPRSGGPHPSSFPTPGSAGAPDSEPDLAAPHDDEDEPSGTDEATADGTPVVHDDPTGAPADDATATTTPDDEDPAQPAATTETADPRAATTGASLAGAGTTTPAITTPAAEDEHDEPSATPEGDDETDGPEAGTAAEDAPDSPTSASPPERGGEAASADADADADVPAATSADDAGPGTTSSGTTGTPASGTPASGTSTTNPASARSRSSSAHPWFTPTGTGNPVVPADDDEEPDGAQTTEARSSGSSEHS